MKKTRTHSIVVLRERTGLSQAHLADMLGINRSLVNMYERNQRSLPTAAVIKLLELEKAMDQHMAAAAPNLPVKTQEKLNKQLQRRADELRYAALLLENKIAAGERKQQQHLQLTLLLDTLAGQQQPGAPKTQQSAWLEMMQAILTSPDNASAAFTLQMDTLRHRMLLLELDELNKMIR